MCALFCVCVSLHFSGWGHIIDSQSRDTVPAGSLYQFSSENESCIFCYWNLLNERPISQGWNTFSMSEQPHFLNIWGRDGPCATSGWRRQTGSIDLIWIFMCWILLSSKLYMSLWIHMSLIHGTLQQHMQTTIVMNIKYGHWVLIGCHDQYIIEFCLFNTAVGLWLSI